MNRGTRLGIVNPLTLVGNEIKTILRERSFPFDKVVLLDSSGQSSGAVTELGDEPALVEAAASDSFEDLDLVFFCGPGENNREWLERSSEDGFAAIDLSRPSAADDAPPIVAGHPLSFAFTVDTNGAPAVFSKEFLASMKCVPTVAK